MAGLGYFSTWLYSKKISLNLQSPPEGWWTYKEAAPWFSNSLKDHAKAAAAKACRPYLPLRSQTRMEESARSLAEKDSIQDGLVCVYAVNEKCRTFRVRYGEGKPRLDTDIRVCSVLYHYYMDREFGLMHVKLQTWFPFTMQIYVNGHEWLARKLASAGMDYRKVDNCFTRLGDVEKANALAKGFWRRDWLRLLDVFGRRVNPHLSDYVAGQNYYWVIDQAEYSMDVLFKDKRFLSTLRPSLYEHAASCFGAEKIMMFLGRKYTSNLKGEVKTHWNRREPGGSVKHWMKRNALKMYDKDGQVLRIEPVINDPSEFRIHRSRNKSDGTQEVGWYPMAKGVANLYRYAEVCQSASLRYLEALSVVDDLGASQSELDRRCKPVAYQGRKRRALQPLSVEDQALFQAVLRGEYHLRGFRNGELAEVLLGPKPEDPVLRRRRCGQIGRRIGLLRAHGMLAKVPRSRRYRVTASGQRFMSTSINLRCRYFPRSLAKKSQRTE